MWNDGTWCHYDWYKVDSNVKFSKPHGWKEFTPFWQGAISLNYFHLYLLYFDYCHNLSKSSPIFLFPHCTFVVHSCLVMMQEWKILELMLYLWKSLVKLMRQVETLHVCTLNCNSFPMVVICENLVKKHKLLLKKLC